MLKKYFIAIGVVLLSFTSFSQVTPKDTIPAVTDDLLAMDTTMDYDDLMSELDVFLDSLLAPRSYFLISASAGSGYFNYPKTNTKIESKRRSVYTPTIGYYHKSGPGITLSGNIINDQQQLDFYQFSVAPSFDLIQNQNWIAGVSYVHYFTKDSLPFYTSPLKNEVNAYFLWRKSWLQPGITASYGWGSKTGYEERIRYIRLLRLRKRGSILIDQQTTEEIADFSLSATLRHSFYWMHVLSEKGYAKFTPQFVFSAGTQKFGFNRTTSAYAVNTRLASYLLYNSGDVTIDNKLDFQPLSLSLYLRPEYNIGKFFIQPQVILDYYFPAEKFSTLFSLGTGFIF
ncbi:hypothetical protein [Terrimonas alba]|uniref:hypothetical protein n=1 Tax=Terrimonas alba TaxID=3349636 RepID=UPI0035F3F28F